ncbi:manganese ABC transporter ATP-binding protein [Boudabousia liubingyangii]|uniref:Manganese ABC transporter ATP-binding protein n=1 Tax=Boudabousia liubingyangii TaxID=1921764 RepID=A0A1Q5PKT8_9ACTO|nr:metal ABC transporter ATP-binding protein [Boudabousia liubingyangii]OKL47221.1 manganese ABC transporter ATP-binding protein [Boudabousia liubingyangii]
MSSSAIEINDLTVAYHDNVVLQGVNLSLPEGEVTALLGANGAGKSTLLKASLNLEPPLRGQVSFFGQPFDAVRARVGYMPQAAQVDWDFPTTVFDTVLMGTYGNLGWFRRPKKPQYEAAQAALAKVGIEDLAQRQISQLSGGQKQRTFMARILAQDPDLFLMDEPFAGVDAASEKALTEVLIDLKNQGKTIVIVHHDLSTVKNFCTWAVLLGNKQVISSGPVEQVFTADALHRAYGIAPELLTTKS